MEGFVNLSIERGVALIEFGHPSHNALPSNLLQALVASIEKADADPAVAVIGLRSAGERTFCAGANFDELLALENLVDATNFFGGFARLLNAMRQCSKLIVVAVQGKAVGGGVGLLSAADYCVATTYAKVRLSELSIGFGPFVIGPAVQRKIGLSAFQTLTLDPLTWQSAEWAQQRGFYQSVVPNAAELEQHFRAKLVYYASLSLPAMQANKRMLWSGTEHWSELLPKRAAISAELALSEETQEALAKFKNKK